MAKITDKTVKSKYPPKQTNVTWIDTSQKPAVTKSYIDGQWVVVGGGVTDYNDIKNKPTINGVELDGNKTSSDLGVATSQQGTKADTAYQKPSSGIPQSDLSSDVQSQLNKHFKGWFASVGYLDTEYPSPIVGDYAYVKGAETTDPAAIYECTTAGSWSDSGRTVDTSNVQTFASSQEVNEVHIVNDLTTGGVDDVLSAEQGKELGDEVFEIRTHQVLNTYISGTVWRPVGSVYSSKYIVVKAGDLIHVVKNSERNPQVAFLQSVDITNPTVVFALGYSTVISTISDSVLYVPSDCYFYWMVDYSGQNFEPQVLTINNKNIINQEYKKSYIKELSAYSAETTEKVEVLENAFKDMVGVYTQNNHIIDFDDVVANKYWNLVNNVAGLVAASDYFARAELYPVNQGDTLIITVDNSIIIDGEETAAYSAYDNDGLPYNGTRARINFNNADSFINNGDGTTTYKFIIKNNTSQVGLYYKIRLVSIKLEGNPSYSYSDSLDEHIEQVAGGGVTTAADSAKYYLKGASPKSFTKKICILTAGQSNIDGRVPYANMPAEIQAAQPIANCNYVKNSESGAFAPINITGLWGFDLVTYYNIALAQELYVIKWSQGGTSIDPLGDSQYHWTADYEDLSSEQYSLLRKFESEIRNHIATDGQQFDIRALLWHQGEGDRESLGTGSADRYYDNLRNMVSYIRGIVGDERLPIITGTISHNSSQYDAKIEEAQQRLALEDPYFCLIDMSGAPLLDSYHFNAASSVYFGEMAYNALIDYGVLSATKLTPTKPW